MARTVWTRENGTEADISAMQENHLMNAYAKSVREGVNPEARPRLAHEISERGLLPQLPDYARYVAPLDLAAS